MEHVTRRRVEQALPFTHVACSPRHTFLADADYVAYVDSDSVTCGVTRRAQSTHRTHSTNTPGQVVGALCCNPRTDVLAVLSSNGTVELYQPTGNQAVQYMSSFVAHSGSAVDAGWMDDTLLTTCGGEAPEKRKIRVWDTRRSLNAAAAVTFEVPNCSSFQANALFGPQYIAATMGKTIWIADLRRSSAFVETEVTSGPVLNVSWSPTRKHVLLAHDMYDVVEIHVSPGTTISRTAKDDPALAIDQLDYIHGCTSDNGNDLMLGAAGDDLLVMDTIHNPLFQKSWFSTTTTTSYAPQKRSPDGGELLLHVLCGSEKERALRSYKFDVRKLSASATTSTLSSHGSRRHLAASKGDDGSDTPSLRSTLNSTVGTSEWRNLLTIKEELNVVSATMQRAVQIDATTHQNGDVVITAIVELPIADQMTRCGTTSNTSTPTEAQNSERRCAVKVTAVAAKTYPTQPPQWEITCDSTNPGDIAIRRSGVFRDLCAAVASSKQTITEGLLQHTHSVMSLHFDSSNFIIVDRGGVDASAPSAAPKHSSGSSTQKHTLPFSPPAVFTPFGILLTTAKRVQDKPAIDDEGSPGSSPTRLTAWKVPLLQEYVAPLHRVRLVGGRPSTALPCKPADSSTYAGALQYHGGEPAASTIRSLFGSVGALLDRGGPAGALQTQRGALSPADINTGKHLLRCAHTLLRDGEPIAAGMLILAVLCCAARRITTREVPLKRGRAGSVPSPPNSFSVVVSQLGSFTAQVSDPGHFSLAVVDLLPFFPCLCICRVLLAGAGRTVDFCVAHQALSFVFQQALDDEITAAGYNVKVILDSNRPFVTKYFYSCAVAYLPARLAPVNYALQFPVQWQGVEEQTTWCVGRAGGMSFSLWGPPDSTPPPSGGPYSSPIFSSACGQGIDDDMQLLSADTNRGPFSSSNLSLTVQLGSGSAASVPQPREAANEPRQQAAAASMCEICGQAIRGLMLQCRKCGHRGHVDHYASWFEQESQCPRGTECQCQCDF